MMICICDCLFQNTSETCCDSISWSEWTYGCSGNFWFYTSKVLLAKSVQRNKQACFWMYYLSDKVFAEDKTALARNWYSTISYGKTQFRPVRSIPISFSETNTSLLLLTGIAVGQKYCCTIQNCWYSSWFDHWTNLSTLWMSFTDRFGQWNQKCQQGHERNMSKTWDKSCFDKCVSSLEHC